MAQSPHIEQPTMAEAGVSAELQALRLDVQVGLDQIAAGEARPFNAAEIVKAGERLAVTQRHLPPPSSTPLDKL
jgi:hypothetical protein